MTTLRKPPAPAPVRIDTSNNRRSVDIKAVLAFGVLGTFWAAVSYGAAYVLAMLCYLLGGHAYTEAYHATHAYCEGYPWFWSAVNWGSLWIWLGALTVAGIVAAIWWAVEYLDEH